MELWFEWDGDLRQSHLYRAVIELAAVADIKRRALLDQGRRDTPPIVWGELKMVPSWLKACKL